MFILNDFNVVLPYIYYSNKNFFSTSVIRQHNESISDYETKSYSVLTVIDIFVIDVNIQHSVVPCRSGML